jgi:hypothetical protein
MKRVLLGVMIFGGAVVLGGCPVYPDNSPGRACGGECCSSADCGYGYYCNDLNQCVANYNAPSYDASAPPSYGPCAACPTGTYCTIANGSPECLPLIAYGDAGSPVPVEDASATTPDTSTPTGDAGGDGATSSGLCNSDAQCGGAGAKCIDGLCTPQSELCSDGTQCLVPGEMCVDGVCVPPCGSCPQSSYGYACDMPRGACSLNPSPCSDTVPCLGGAVCVEERCVVPCSTTDGGPQCASGQVCVNGGCIPDQQARFTCRYDGKQGSVANSCDSTSYCLHGDCYPACNAEGGACATPGDVCKAVQVTTGTYFVCAPATNLGSECNPAVGSYCPPSEAGPGVCVDGYCK